MTWLMKHIRDYRMDESEAWILDVTGQVLTHIQDYGPGDLTPARFYKMLEQPASFHLRNHMPESRQSVRSTVLRHICPDYKHLKVFEHWIGWGNQPAFDRPAEIAMDLVGQVCEEARLTETNARHEWNTFIDGIRGSDRYGRPGELFLQDLDRTVDSMFRQSFDNRFGLLHRTAASWRVSNKVLFGMWPRNRPVPKFLEERI